MTTTYLFNKSNRANIMSIQRQAISVIQSFFAKYPLLMGKPIFIIHPEKVTVQLFYYAPLEKISNTSINILGNTLTRC